MDQHNCKDVMSLSCYHSFYQMQKPNQKEIYARFYWAYLIQITFTHMPFALASIISRTFWWFYSNYGFCECICHYFFFLLIFTIHMTYVAQPFWFHIVDLFLAYKIIMPTFWFFPNFYQLLNNEHKWTARLN